MKLAIITPCYNAGDLLLDAVQSVIREATAIRQKHPDCELVQVIIDDRSDDSVTRLHLAELQQMPHCEALANTGSRGPAGARNFGLRHVTADWYGFLDSFQPPAGVWSSQKASRRTGRESSPLCVENITVSIQTHCRRGGKSSW